MVERIMRGSAAKARQAGQTKVAARSTAASMTHRREVIEQTSQDENLGETYFPEGVEPAFVRVAVGQTYNLGNFESMRLDVSVTLPCRVEDVDATYTAASDYCAEKLLAEEVLWLGAKR